jgi:hypothetical protein
METFSLVQDSLDQTLTLEALEAASDAVRVITRMDAAKLWGEKSGIFMTGMERGEAMEFQAALKAAGFATTLVADHELPQLHESFQVQRIDIKEEMLVLTDSLGRVRSRPLTDLVFLSAGWFKRIACKTEWSQYFGFSDDARRSPMLRNERKFHEEPEMLFRMDFFFWGEPNRLHIQLSDENAAFFQGEVVRLKKADALLALLAAMAALMPPQRLNTVLRKPNPEVVYPSLMSYEKEIRWHFHQLKSG